MLSKEYIPFIKLQLVLGYFSFCLPFEWDNVQRRLKLMKYQKRKFYWIFLSILLIGYLIKTISMWFELIILFFKSQNNHDIEIDSYIKPQSVCLCFGSACFLLMQIFNIKNRNEGCNLINALIDFEERHESKLKNKSNLTAKTLIGLGCLSSISCPLLTTMLVAVVPCLPPFFGSFLLDCPDEKPRIQELSIILGFEMLMNLFAWTSGMWIVFIGFFVGILCIHSFIAAIYRTPFEKSSFEAYREIQMLSILFNTVNQKGILPVVMFAALTTPSIAMFLVVGYHDELPLPLLGFFILVICDGLFVLLFYIFGFAGRIHKNSEDVLNIWRHDRFTYCNKLHRRYVNALTCMKIRFGATNFMERSTCLACVQFSVSQAASLLLASQKQS